MNVKVIFFFFTFDNRNLEDRSAKVKVAAELGSLQNHYGGVLPSFFQFLWF